MKDRAIYYVDGAVTVCLLQENGEIVARGISVCSRADYFDLHEGRRYARNRALEARGRGRDCGEIRLDLPRSTWFDMVHLSLARDRFGNFKGQYKPILTETEKLVFKLKNGNRSDTTYNIWVQRL